MKSVKIFFIVLMGLGLLYSCSETEDFSPANSDQELIDAIAAASKTVIAPSELPAPASSSLSAENTEDYVEQALKAEKLGYQVNLRREKGTEVGVPSEAYFDTNGRRLRGDSQKHGKGPKGGQRKCFEFVLPVTFTMPDGSAITISSEAEWPNIRAWYQANPGTTEKPAVVFPVDINYGDEVMTLSNQEELDAAHQACAQDRPDRPGKRKCFELVYPYSVTMPDGSLITLESDDDRALIREWHENNPDVEEHGTLNFPVDIRYPDGSVITINSQEELKEAGQACREDDRGKRCFRPVFPFSVTMPDGTVITLEEEGDRQAIREWYQANPDRRRERPEFVFPIDIEYQDGNVATINSAEELRAAKDSCADESDD